MILVRPVGTIFPDAVAMMSTWPKTAHVVAIAKNRMMVAPIIRPAGEAGVSRISRAAGRNWRAVSSRVHFSRAPSAAGRLVTGSTDDMKARLQLVEGGVS